MPKCQVCLGPFEPQSWGSPEEPCWCGAMLSLQHCRDIDRATLDTMKRNWVNELDRRRAAIAVGESK